MRTRSGFTIIEICIVTVFAVLAFTLFWFGKADLDSKARDAESKTSINAMFYSLEEGFYAKNGFYPEQISDENLTTMDPAFFTDPYGININDQDQASSFSYTPSSCVDGKCQHYQLRAVLEQEGDFIRMSRQ